MKPSTCLHAQPRWVLCAALLSACVAAGCATTAPVVYQTSKPTAAASQRLAKDVQACEQRASSAVGVNARNAHRAAQGSARGGAIGFAATAVGALVNSSRDAWQRARAGAAGGAAGVATKTLLEWNDPDEVYQEYVERCLDARGHDVLGWR